MKKRFLKFLIVIGILFININIVKAASFTINASTSLTKGGKTQLTIKGSDVTGRFNITTSNASIISIGEDRVWIENNSYSITLNALSVGTSTITVTPVGVSDSNGNLVNLSSKSIKINVSLPREKSTDNTLKSLSVEGYDLNPAFSSNNVNYKVIAPEGTKSVNVKATTNSSYAKITGTGVKEVTNGINNLTIVVTSESGVQKVYNVTVEVVDTNPINVVVDNESYTIVKLRNNFTCPEYFNETEVVISDTTIPACKNDAINYLLIGLKDSEGNIESYVYNPNNINKYYSLYSYAYSSDLKIIITGEKELENHEKTTININNEEFEGYKYGNTGRYFIVYGKNIVNGEENFYLYDSKNNTFSVYDEELFINEIEENDIYKYAVIAFGVGLFLAIICIISLNHQKNKMKKHLIELSKNKEIKKEEKNNKKK